jgi:hydroxylamine dehydrogenase
MTFRAVFIAVVLGTALLVGAYVLNALRPRGVVEQPTAELIRASGKCAECHARTHESIVREYGMSKHARSNVNCLECHQPAQGQAKREHNGFTIAERLNAANCRPCHEAIYQQFLRSRHAAPSWAAVFGEHGGAKLGEPDLTPDQVAFSEQYQPGSVRRPPNALAALEGPSAAASGCASCHGVGRPNTDGTIGTCTACHARHTASVELARLPRTCGQCHMGPDHSQIEIYEESRHGILFDAQRDQLDLKVSSRQLTTKEMFVPTCATCHMSGLNGQASTHDPSERLSYFLANEISEPRPQGPRAGAAMREVCQNCHTTRSVQAVYDAATKVVAQTNERVKVAKAIVDGLRKDGLLTGPPFSHPIDFAYFDIWHYHGRTSKHGAFMGGADFVQWHGNYPLIKATLELQAMADELRKSRGK